MLRATGLTRDVSTHHSYFASAGRPGERGGLEGVVWGRLYTTDSPSAIEGTGLGTGSSARSHLRKRSKPSPRPDPQAAPSSTHVGPFLTFSVVPFSFVRQPIRCPTSARQKLELKDRDALLEGPSVTLGHEPELGERPVPEVYRRHRPCSPEWPLPRAKR